MKAYSTKFDEQYKGKQSIDIELFNDEPLTMKYARYNQSGEVCSRMVEANQANQKTKNGWKQVQCDTYNCEYRQKNESGKCACNRIGWLKFMIPSVCKDRIFLMRITGQKSLDRLDEYFSLQKAQGNSIKGQYTLFLKQEEQSNSFCKTFNNYVLDILKKEDFISQNTIPKTVEKPKELSTNNAQNVNNQVVNNNSTPTITEVKKENNATPSVTAKQDTKSEVTQAKETKEITKKTTKSKSKKTEVTKPEEQKETDKKQEKSIEDDEFKNCYALLSTFNKTIANKEYLVGKFADMQDKISDIVIRPEDASELSQCDLGTYVRLEVTEIKGRKFAIKLEFIEKALKKVAA